VATGAVVMEIRAMDIWEAGQLSNRIRSWIILAMLAGAVIYTLFSAAHDIVWPPPAKPAVQPASGPVRAR
jgi:hypothetical protein